jgi:hypothetical protein
MRCSITEDHPNPEHPNFIIPEISKFVITNEIFSTKHHTFQYYIHPIPSMGFYNILTMSLLTTIPILYTFPAILAHFFKFQGYNITDQVDS